MSDIDTLPKQVTVIENIINLGKSLDLSVVAEGVETHQQATLLSNLQCHSIQGFHFYRPQPKHEIERALCAKSSSQELTRYSQRVNIEFIELNLT
ncbi:EAL domain-containing protein [Vibrio sp. M60_M31a]